MARTHKVGRVFDRIDSLVGHLLEPVQAASFYGELWRQPRISFWHDNLFLTTGPYIVGITIPLLIGALIFGHERIEPVESAGQDGVSLSRPAMNTLNDQSPSRQGLLTGLGAVSVPNDYREPERG